MTSSRPQSHCGLPDLDAGHSLSLEAQLEDGLEDGLETGAHPGPGHVRHRKRLRNVLTCSTHRLADESENSVTILYIFGEIAFYIILGVFCEDIITYYINFSIFS